MNKDIIFTVYNNIFNYFTRIIIISNLVESAGTK